MSRCAPKKDGYADSLCSVMVRASERFASPRQKGLIAGNMVNMESGERLGTIIQVSSGEFIGKGNRMLLNFCPFCGGQLHDQHDVNKFVESGF